MRIAIIGAGNVGGTLGLRWAETGHDVVFGVRNPAKPSIEGNAAKALAAGAAVASVAESVHGADAVVLTTPWAAVPDALREAGAEDGALDGVALLDATNPLAAGLALDPALNGTSGGERVQSLASRAHVVKVFNTTGFDNMADPTYDGAPTVMFYAGDDAGAKRTAHELARAIGFDPIDAGGLARAQELEHWAVLWISLALGAAGAPAQGRSFAFRLVRR